MPATAPLQRYDLPFVFPVMLGMQAQPYLQATEPVVPPDGEQRDEATIYLDLARACGASLFGSKLAQRLVEGLRRLSHLRHPARAPSVPQEWLLSAILRLSGQGSFGKLLQSPHGRLRPPHTGGDFLGKRCVTDDGRVHLTRDGARTWTEITPRDMPPLGTCQSNRGLAPRARPGLPCRAALSVPYVFPGPGKIQADDAVP